MDIGEGDPILFLHGNPTWSYLWRNIIPYLAPQGRCIALDLIGMGRSDKPDIHYGFFDHAAYLEAFIAKLGLRNLTLVIQDWGSALGFYYAMRHETKVKGLAFMEAILMECERWEDMMAEEIEIFQKFRTAGIGWEMLVEQNYFVEELLPFEVLRPARQGRNGSLP